MNHQAIEQMLLAYRPADPPSRLRQRALTPPRDCFSFWEAFAACLLVGLCLIQVLGAHAAIAPELRLESPTSPADYAQLLTATDLASLRKPLIDSPRLPQRSPFTGNASWETP